MRRGWHSTGPRCAPFEQRMQTDTVYEAQPIKSDEGIWLISRPTASKQEDGYRYETPSGVQYICQPEYGEVLLLASEKGPILRAFPFPSVPPTHLVLAADALYCARQGDGGVPDSMACRIDRKSMALNARVFPSNMDSGYQSGSEAYRPKTWTVDTRDLQVNELVVNESGLWARNHQRTWTQLHLRDLRVVAENVAAPK